MGSWSKWINSFSCPGTGEINVSPSLLENPKTDLASG